MPRLRGKRRSRRRLATVTHHAVLATWSVVILFPLSWLFATSLKRPDEWFGWPPLMRPRLTATFPFLFIRSRSEHFLGLILSQTGVATLPMHRNRFAGSGGHGYVTALSLGAEPSLNFVGLATCRHLGCGLSFGLPGRYRR